MKTTEARFNRLYRDRWVIAAIFLSPLLLAPFVRVEFPHAQAQQVANIGEHLSFTPRPKVLPFQSDHYDVPLCFCAAMQVQHHLRTGEDVPLSPQFLITVAGRLSSTDDITIRHGWSSPILGWQLAHSFGSCPAPLCTRLGILTEAMHDAAVPFRVGQEFLTLFQIPDYPSAVAYLAEHPGAVVILTTSGRRAYAIIGVDEEGRGVWLDYWRRATPAVLHMSAADGTETWNAMLYADKELGPENFLVVVNPR